MLVSRSGGVLVRKRVRLVGMDGITGTPEARNMGSAVAAKGSLSSWVFACWRRGRGWQPRCGRKAAAVGHQCV